MHSRVQGGTLDVRCLLPRPRWSEYELRTSAVSEGLTTKFQFHLSVMEYGPQMGTQMKTRAQVFPSNSDTVSELRDNVA
jgi:hypothetical protein